MRNRQLVGILLGLALALAGPGGLAVGFFSHPVGILSHPASVHGDVYAYEYAIGQSSSVGPGTRAYGYAYAYRDAGLHARARTDAGEYRRSGDVTAYAYLRVCDPSCRTVSIGASGSKVDFQLGPLMGSATVSGRSGGKNFSATFEASGPPGVERFQWGFQRIPEILLYGSDNLNLYRPMRVTSITIGDVSVAFSQAGWGQGARSAGASECVAVRIPWC